MHLKRFLAALALVLACAACSNPFADAPDEFGQSFGRWRRAGLADYHYVLSGSCECLPEWTRPAEVLVRDGETLFLRYLNNYSTDVWSRYRELDSVEKLFQFVGDAYARDPDVLEVEYHPRYGVPTRILVDYDREVGDDELTITVSDFVPVVSQIP